MALRELTFLVVEDHELQREGLVGTLERLGARAVHAAADGGRALAILESANPSVDVVISDLDMPGMDGMEFLRRVGEAGAGTSVIIASALESRLVASIATMSEAYGIALLGVLEKPLTPEKLLATIALHSVAAPMAEASPGPRLSLEEIEQGLRDDEFEPFYQPKVELATGRITGFEALARWRHGRLGLLPPDAFIRKLEEAGRIDELMWVMLRKAATACRTWLVNGLEATVAVNISPTSLGDVRMAERVTALLHWQALEPRSMVLEVTESAAATHVGAALENLARLRVKGFGLSIDDYGTGYSSMQQLTRVAFTELKIDQSFVLKAATHRSALVILESSLRMARKLKIASVAEGVETRAAFDLLRSLQCDMAQGYFIARPMEASAVLSWAREWKQPDDDHELFATNSRRRTLAKRLTPPE
ncbi:MAG: EAL domain-containing response regulator [Vicinamibacteria bacterium]|nr:EAL domain-containing response regulator [Vicinamibacteria bacterium]